MSLERVIFSWPTSLDLKDTTDAAPRSWIQLARTGSFVSKRYGKFSITKEDLSQMLHNWRHVTPANPTEIPVDFDHLSMDPKRPGDGAAAGWMKRLELRSNGDELWAEVEWTPEGAKRIENREYRFVSPSFVKDHTHKDGRKIGTTLLAAAITNHPFLEGMKAVTLGNDAVLAMHLNETLRDLVAVSLSATPGQRVTVSAQHARDPRHVGMTFEVVRVEGTIEARVWLKNASTGEEIGWYLPEELEPARVQNADPSRPEKSEDPMMKVEAGDRIMARAQALAAERQIHLSAAVKLASAEDADAARAYLDHPEPMAAEPSPATFNLRRDDGETLPALVARVARERFNGDQVAAYRLVASAHPDLAEAYSRGEF